MSKDIVTINLYLLAIMLLLARTKLLSSALRIPTTFLRFSTKPNKIVFLGTPDVSALCLDILSRNADSLNYEIIGVVTQPPTPSGRSLAVSKSPVHKLADTLNIPIFCPVKANESDFIQKLSEMDIDLCITAAYGNYLPKSFLKIPRFGTVNIHPSLLPKYELHKLFYVNYLSLLFHTSYLGIAGHRPSKAAC